jgi:tetratricopeptide (TPR) repeat protein
LVVTALFALSALCCSGANAQTDAQRKIIQEADQLLKQNNPGAAYERLAPLEDQLAGNVDYDYLLGIAALDSGKADKATLAFERVIAINPNFAGARLDMARAYYQLGDLTRARAEFDIVLQQNPPEEARQTVQRYLAAIEAAGKAQQRRVRAYLEYSLGHDSNINNSTSQSLVTAPGIGNISFTLDPTSVRTSSGFNGLAAGGEVVENVLPGLAVFAGADWRLRDNSKSDVFDYQNFDYRAGLMIGQANNQLRVTGNYGRYYLNSAFNRDADGLGADWRYALSPSSQLNLFSQYGRVRLTGEATRVNSFNSTTSGIGGLHAFGDGSAALFGAFFFGDERDVIGRADGPKRFHGLRVGGQAKLRDDIDLFGYGSAQRGYYGKENVSFLATRLDETTDVGIGLNWRFMKDWALRPQVLHTRNTSNIPIYQFTRTEASISVRRDFNF